MARQSVYVDPDRTPLWVYQRAHRLARGGRTVGEIGAILHTSAEQAASLLRRPSKYQRCPTCRGMVLLPCQICQLRGVTEPGV